MDIFAPKKYYEYTLIKDLKVGTVYNVFGVVKAHRDPAVTRSGLNMLCLWIADESSTEDEEEPNHLPCVLFESDKISLPQVHVGDVVRFHRLRISLYQGHRQGKMAPGFSWYIF